MQLCTVMHVCTSTQFQQPQADAPMYAPGKGLAGLHEGFQGPLVGVVAADVSHHVEVPQTALEGVLRGEERLVPLFWGQGTHLGPTSTH